MHQLSMAQGQIQDQFHADLENVLKKLGISRLPKQQNSLAIILSCETLLKKKYVFDFNVKKAEIDTDMSNSNVHSSLRELKDRYIVVSDSAGRIGINLNLDEWEIPEKIPRVRRGLKKSASRSKKSKKSGRSQGGSGKRSGTNSASKNSVAKAEIIPPESDQIPEESEEILDDVNEILENLEPFADSINNSPESEEISAESTEIQGEFEQIHYKTTSRNKKTFSQDSDCVDKNTPAKRGVFLNNNKNIKTPPSGGLVSKSDSDNNQENHNSPAERGVFSLEKNVKSPPSGGSFDNEESAAISDSDFVPTKTHADMPLLLPASEKSASSAIDSGKVDNPSGEASQSDPGKSFSASTESKKAEIASGARKESDPKIPPRFRVRKRSIIVDDKRDEDWIPYSERPFPGSNVEDPDHQPSCGDSSGKAALLLPKNSKYANRPYPCIHPEYKPNFDIQSTSASQVGNSGSAHGTNADHAAGNQDENHSIPKKADSDLSAKLSVNSPAASTRWLKSFDISYTDKTFPP